MRLKEKVIDLDYNKTKAFFESRAAKYDEKYPYNTTMYQDANKELTNKRNEAEQSKILPYLKLNKNAKMIDIACGIGRWGDAVKKNIKGYYGIDFSQNLIKIAKERNTKKNYYFEEASVQQLQEVINREGWGKFNRVIMGGIIIYLNDKEIMELFRTIKNICDEDSIIYIREPIAIDSRLTLKDFYSDELNTEYHAVYRTKQEYMSFIKILIDDGFMLRKDEELFNDEDILNNRKETVQHFLILERTRKQ